MFGKRNTLSVIALRALMAIALSSANAGESKRVLKIMTRNMDAGTDLNLIFYFLPDIPKGVSATLEQLRSTNIPARAARLADEIRNTQPDFIGLQEVTEWRTGVCGSTTVLYDQLQLLLDALASRNMHYSPLSIQAF